MAAVARNDLGLALTLVERFQAHRTLKSAHPFAGGSGSSASGLLPVLRASEKPHTYPIWNRVVCMQFLSVSSTNPCRRHKLHHGLVSLKCEILDETSTVRDAKTIGKRLAAGGAALRADAHNCGGYWKWQAFAAGQQRCS
jgi:hypothetical protein